MNGLAAPAGAGKGKPWQRRLAIGAWVFSGLCVLGVLGAVVWVMYEVRQPAGAERGACCWQENATPEWTAGVLGLRVPETATDRRAGLHSNEQYDAALLAFTVTTAEADRFVRPLRREGTRMLPNPKPEKQGFTRSDGFTHLGLPEPETLVQGMLSTSVCPREAKTPESGALRLCAQLHTHELQPGTTRVYIWAGSDAPIERPPS
ncbi:hypothetical protein [Streptomyces sp. NPDC048603]|uniref:hypothetical protein n=1 Tax=Streptomyces sp. NPDC048603 TaxID=3365577 RepID=UPI00371CBA66